MTETPLHSPTPLKSPGPPETTGNNSEKRGNPGNNYGSPSYSREGVPEILEISKKIQPYLGGKYISGGPGVFRHPSYVRFPKIGAAELLRFLPLVSCLVSCLVSGLLPALFPGCFRLFPGSSRGSSRGQFLVGFPGPGNFGKATYERFSLLSY